MWRALASNALTVFIVLLIGAALGISWAQETYRGSGPLAQAICLRVEPGSTMSRVSKELEEQGAIASGALFRMGANYTGKTNLLKAGSFLVQPESSMEQIIEVVTRGGANTCGSQLNFRIGILQVSVVVQELDPATNKYREVMKFLPAEEETPAGYDTLVNASDIAIQITVAEGATSWQVVEGLKQASFLTGEIADVPAEGILAPKAYEVTRGTARGDVLARMQAEQAQLLADLWAARNPEVPLKTPEEALVLASIIEKETGVPDERGQVASVFTNRLRQGMRLQTDPTVIYGITKGQGALGRGLRQSELQRATPYNTYVIEGLPPTPIANPGAESLRAALNPLSTDYIFFVADGTGGHAFAVTLAEHNANVEKWRKIEAERR